MAIITSADDGVWPGRDRVGEPAAKAAVADGLDIMRRFVLSRTPCVRVENSQLRWQAQQLGGAGSRLHSAAPVATFAACAAGVLTSPWLRKSRRGYVRPRNKRGNAMKRPRPARAPKSWCLY